MNSGTGLPISALRSRRLSLASAPRYRANLWQYQIEWSELRRLIANPALDLSVVAAHVGWVILLLIVIAPNVRKKREETFVED